LAWLLVLLLFILLIFAAPRWPYSRGWGWYPTIIMSVLLAILAFLLAVSY